MLGMTGGLWCLYFLFHRLIFLWERMFYDGKGEPKEKLP